MSETKPKRTTQPRDDHTHWICGRVLAEGSRCQAKMELKDDVCSECRSPRGRTCNAVNESGETLGSWIDKEGGKDVWLYLVVSNGNK